jgi:hypothetical protein
VFSSGRYGALPIPESTNVEREIHVNMALIKIHFELLSREACFYNEVSSALARAERVQERQGLPVVEAVQMAPCLKKV